MNERRISRRAILEAGLRAGAMASLAGLFLTGCASGRRRTALPDPRWPASDGRVSGGVDLSKYEPVRPASPPWSSRADVSRTPASIPSPMVRPRSQWAGARPIPSRMDRMLPVRRITVHHDGMDPVELRSVRDVAARLDHIRSAHQSGRGWGDIGYHYVIDPLGGAWEGRPLVWQGAHVANQNEGNIGILALGNFEVQRPTNAQLAALYAFVKSQMRVYRVPVGRVHTHRELAPTACPGRNLQPHMVRARGIGGVLV